MKNEFEELSTQEKELIRQHRAEEARKAQTVAFRLKAIRVAAEYEQWLQDNGRGDSYSTFANEFGYDDPQRNLIHECVVRIRDAATIS